MSCICIWREIVEKDCHARGLNREDAMDRSRWMKQIRDDWWPRWVWVGECFFWYWLTRVVPDKIHRAVKRFCVCVCVTDVLTNRLGSSLPLGSECVSLETWDDGARCLLTLKTSRRRLGGQPVVEPHRPIRTPHSSRCRLQVCMSACVFVPNLSGLVAEMIQAKGYIGTQWILDLCNGIVKEGCIDRQTFSWSFFIRSLRSASIFPAALVCSSSWPRSRRILCRPLAITESASLAWVVSAGCCAATGYVWNLGTAAGGGGGGCTEVISSSMSDTLSDGCS